MPKTVSLQLPEALVELWESLKEKEPIEQDLKEQMVLALLRKHRITIRKGAELLGMNYQDFLEFMAENDVPLFDYSPGELEKDVETLRKLRESK